MKSNQFGKKLACFRRVILLSLGFVASGIVIPNQLLGTIEEDNLRQQLHDYKARFFRSSHPQDMEKIQRLEKLIAEHQEESQRLMEKLQSLEKDILVARKQNSTLEITADALSAMIQAQKSSAVHVEEKYAKQLLLITDELLLAQLIADNERSIAKSLSESVQQQLENISKEKASLYASRDADKAEIELLNQHFQVLALKHASVTEYNKDLEIDYKHVSNELEEQKHNLAILSDHFQRLTTANQAVLFQLADASIQQSQLQEKLSLVESNAAKRESEASFHHIAHALKVNELKKILANDVGTINELSAQIAMINNAVKEEGIKKFNAVDEQLQSLTDEYNEVLLEASSAISKVEQLNRHLYDENRKLKDSPVVYKLGQSTHGDSLGIFLSH